MSAKALKLEMKIIWIRVTHPYPPKVKCQWVDKITQSYQKKKELHAHKPISYNNMSPLNHTFSQLIWIALFNMGSIVVLLFSNYLEACQSVDAAVAAAILFLIDAIWPNTALLRNMVLVWHISSIESMAWCSMMACAYLLVRSNNSCMAPLSFGLPWTIIFNGWIRSPKSVLSSSINGCVLKRVLMIWITASFQGRR